MSKIVSQIHKTANNYICSSEKWSENVLTSYKI
jgi:hypothetical protein